MTDRDGNERNPLTLTLSPDGPQRRERVCIKVEVKNVDKRAWHWDREFSIFVVWRVRDVNDHDIRPRSVGKPYSKTKQLIAKDRFVPLEPGCTLAKSIVLTQKVRDFAADTDSSSSGDIHPNRWHGREQDVKFIMPKKVGKIMIRAEYLPWINTMGAFREMFGYDVKDAGMDIRVCRSNELLVAFDDGDR